MNAIEFINVSKKFRKGEKFDSLRDLIPNLVKSLSPWNGKKKEELEEQEFWAVKDVSFELKKGEALGIIGPNGAGKSTILKLLNRILKPTKGVIKISGKLNALLEAGAGFHPDLTGRENIYLSGAIVGMRKEEIDKKFDSIVEFSELGDFIDTPVKRYSSGMYTRLGFSVAVNMDPEILLIDEVLSVGDFRFQNKCIQKMHGFIKKGVTIIFISHNLPSVIELCPKTILLNKGQTQEIGESKKVVHDYYRAWSEIYRSDKGEIRKIRSELLNINRQPSSTFKAGEVGILRMEFVSELELENIAVVFSVKCEDGLIIFDAHSELYEGKVYSFCAGEKKLIEIVFNIALPEGLYYLGLYLQQGETIYFYDDELCQFYVTSPKLSARSYTFLDPKWV